MMQKTKKMIRYLTLFLVTFVADRLTKLWAVAHARESIAVCDSLTFSLSWNRGVSWSFFNEASMTGFYILTFIIISLITVFAVYTYVQHQNHFPITYEILVLSGAFSNVVDRFVYGAVVDFIDFYVGTWHWPTFNFADVFIVIGVLGIIWGSFSDKR